MRPITYLVCALVALASVEADRHLHYTKDTEFLRRQEFVYQLFWNPDDLSENHANIVNRAENLKVEDLRDLPLNQNAVEEFIDRYEKNGLLPRGRSATAFNAGHLAEIKNVVEILYSAKDFDTFAVIVLWSNKVLNQILWFFDVATAIFHRSDTRLLRLPNLHESLPQYFYNRDVIEKFEAIKNSKNCSGEKVVIAEYSKLVSRPGGNDPESKITYFTEDIGLSNFYFFLNLDLPFFLKGSKYNLASYRRGDRYFSDHGNLLARYNLERASNGLGGIEDLDLNDSIVTGYYPKMNDYNGIPFPARPSNATVPADKVKYVEMVEDSEKRLRKAADEAVLQLKDGKQYIDDNVDRFFSNLMNAVQGNADSMNLKFYGSLELVARHILGFSPEPVDNFHVIISAMENYNADLRDPAFYSMYKKIVGIGRRFKSHLAPYTKEELGFPGVKIEEVTVGEVTTFFDEFESLLGYQECPGKKNPVLVRQQRLNHKDFNVNLKVTSNKTNKAIVRLFLGPRKLNVAEARNGFYQLDKFLINLKEGDNYIKRKDSEFAFQVPDDTRSDSFYRVIEEAVKEGSMFGYYEQPYGFPRRLSVPRGTAKGLDLRLLAVVSPLEKKVRVDSLMAGKDFYDGRAIGFPLDRPVDSLGLNVPNLAFEDVSVFHVDA